MTSQAELVKQFTEESKGIKVPERPSPMNETSTRFLAKMMISEIVEMLESHHEPEKAREIAHKLIIEDQEEKQGNKKCNYPKPKEIQIEEQMDAMVDCAYYALDSAAKHGMNLDPVFNEVHKANMRKRNPLTGKFERREDGKVIKPEGWQPADIRKVVAEQIQNGGFH
jgi:predicted HAD superfamily Cof-like phosphohydrolase